MSKESIIKKVLKEMTSTNGVDGYVPPILPGYHEFEKSQLAPFSISVTPFDSPELEHDVMDGKMSTPKHKRKKIEKRAEVGTKHAENNYDFITIGESEWIDVDKIPLNEDLAVWFGTKKKPKGSKQPKGPWVNICRKVNGKHPPCGRPDTSKGAYPKCRAAGVAGKMSDSQKRAACQQKRKAEKQDTQTGKGQKPVMTSYKPKKESVLSKKTIVEKFKIEPNEKEKIYEDDNFLFVIPLTHAASCKYGANTKWCTSSSDETMFNKHNKMGSLGYLIIKDIELQKKLESSKFGFYINKPNETYLGGRYPSPDGVIIYDEKNNVVNYDKIMNLFDRYNLYGKLMNIIHEFTNYSNNKFEQMGNSKTIKLTESDLVRIVKKVLSGK